MAKSKRYLGYYLAKRMLRKTRLEWLRLRSLYFQDFVFIHINKTGGSSIVKALDIPFEHKTALEKKAELGERRWHNRFCFTIVQNPWDKVVSHYHFRAKTHQTGFENPSIPFQEWVKLTYGEQDLQYYDKPKMFMPQWNWITDHEGRVLVDFIGRFENIEVAFREINRRLNRYEVKKLPHVKQSNRGPYHDYYDSVTRDIVGEWFKSDIENFGYNF